MTEPRSQPPLETDPNRQDRNLLRIFNYYRLILSLILILIYFNEAGQAFIGLEYPALFIFTSIIYTAINLGLALVLRGATSLHPRQITTNIFVDIFALLLLTYANGGVGSGFGILVILSIAAGSILIHGRYALLFAAVASIAMISLEMYRAVMDGLSPNYFQAGILGMVYFATSAFTKGISKRIDASESLATQRASDIAHLEQLNQLIIQRMRTGIIVCDKEGNVRMMNEAAVSLLSTKEDAAHDIEEHPKKLPPPLLQRLFEWEKAPQRRTAPFQTSPDNPEIQANFASFLEGERSDVLIFLEDNSKAMQQAQQLKLASLGQLTASIAHEIRNPLGAISHAAQLLDESDKLDEADRRLALIVQDHSKRMNSTIENILELSRRRPSSPEPIPLKSWLRDYVKSFNEAEQNIGEFDIEVSPEDLEVHIDPSQLVQILTNLSRNGLFYSREHSGIPRLQFKGGIHSGTEFPYLDIIDEGKGISQEQLPHLFEPFYTTERTGTGLGLYISRELCQANNARLDYVANHPGGCCFRITFPHPKQVTA